MPPSSTRLEIEEEIVRILMQLDESTRLDPVPLIGTISAVGTITSPQLDRGTLQANRYDGRLIKVAEDATAVAFVTPVTVTGVHTAVITTLTVSSTTEIRAGDVLEIGTTLEKVLVRAVVSGTSLTVTRGWQGTTATATSGGETVRYDPLGQVTGVDDGGFAAGGILTISPNFSLAGYGAGTFYLYPKGLHPDYLIEKMNGVLRNTDHPHIWFPSLVVDSDFESNDISNFPAVGTPTTRQFVSTDTLVNISTTFLGERVIDLRTDADAEGLSTASIWVVGGEQLLVSVNLITSDSGDMAEVILRDVTAGADLHTVTNIPTYPLTEVRFRETIPNGTFQSNIQILSTGSDAESFVISPPVLVQSDRRRTYPGPSWLTRESQLIGTVRLPQGYTAEVADTYIGLSEFLVADADVSVIRADRYIRPFQIQLSNPGNDPLGLLCMRPFAELVGDNSTTVADKDYVALKTVSNILRDRKDNAWKHWAGRASNIARRNGYGGRELQVREQLTYAGTP